MLLVFPDEEPLEGRTRWEDAEGREEEAPEGPEEDLRGVAEEEDESEDRGTNCDTEETPRGGPWEEPWGGGGDSGLVRGQKRKKELN